MESPYIQTYVVLSKLFHGEIDNNNNNNNNNKGTDRCARTEAVNITPPATTRQG
jgi:hypothetical protein